MPLSWPSWSLPSFRSMHGAPVAATPAADARPPVDVCAWPKAVAVNARRWCLQAEAQMLPRIRQHKPTAIAAAACAAGAAVGLCLGTWPATALGLGAAALSVGVLTWRTPLHCPPRAQASLAPIAPLAPPSDWRERLQASERVGVHLQHQMRAEKAQFDAHVAELRSDCDALRQQVCALQDAARRRGPHPVPEPSPQALADLERARAHQRKSDAALDRLTTAKAQLQASLVAAKEENSGLEQALAEQADAYNQLQRTHARQTRRHASRVRQLEAQIAELSARHDDLEAQRRESQPRRQPLETAVRRPPPSA